MLNPKIPLLLAALALPALTVCLGAQAVNASPLSPPTIVTTGSGEARVAPDRATIFVGIQSRAATAAAAGSDNARRQRAIVDTLRSLGLSSEQLATVNYNVTPEIQYPTNGQGAQRVTGYVVTNTVRADVRRLDDVTRVIDAGLAKGANEISSLQFYSSRADSARRAALATAVANARADAESVARAAGGSLGSVIEISTTEPPIRPLGEVVFRATSAATRTPIEAGEQTVNASVTARWIFIPRS